MQEIRVCPLIHVVKREGGFRRRLHLVLCWRGREGWRGWGSARCFKGRAVGDRHREMTREMGEEQI